jgi:excisionase family DNA binding protein
MHNTKEIKSLAVKPEEAARMLGIGRNLMYEMIKSGDIQAIRLGERRLLVPVAALEKLLSTNHQEAAGQ